MSRSVPAAPSALHTLVSAIVDYAGLFPPASLDMHMAVANYAGYRAGADAWMLGRFVVPAARLGEWESSVQALTPAAIVAWSGATLSALLSGEFAQEAQRIADFNARAPFGVRIDVAEGRANMPYSVLAMSAALPDDVMLYCEIPHRDDPTELLLAVRSANVRAKIRTGGTTPDAFPQPAEIVRFLRRCMELGVTAKATAGLHHPLGGDYRLTYAPDAVRGVMYGYLNVFLAAAAIRAGASDVVATTILQLMDVTAITVTADGLSVAGFDLPASALAEMRTDGVVAFGSCSFREPVDELQQLSLGDMA